jgi:hypothetical protein
MWRGVISFIVALLVVSSAASAQQPCTTDARKVVDELYRHMLERSADLGSATWVAQLQNGRATVRDVVREIAKSSEHNQRFIKQEAGEETPYVRSVNRLYRHILGRQPDAEGARHHADNMARNGVNAVIEAIVNSPEYNQTYGDWGVPGSGGINFCPPAGQISRASPSAPPDAGDLTDAQFRAMDRNNDGVITEDEWRGSRAAFRARDRNQDGLIARNEMRDDRFDTAVGTTGDEIIVDASQRWTDAGLDVRSGELVLFDADGTARLSDDPNDSATPSGSRTGRRAANAPVRQGPAGGLIARIGDGQPAYVGAHGSIRARTSGRLYLGVNDDFFGDNTGEYRVQVTVRDR